MKNWQDKIASYCNDYNIPLYYLADTLQSSKVIPMIRGKAFEFTILEKLSSLLDAKKWEVSNPGINAQLGLQDIDVLVTHKKTGKKISIECKLSKKGGCSVKNDKTEISIKCMRSRTMGLSIIKRIAPKLGVSTKLLSIHNDQYFPHDFDFVITSIGNSFYQTKNQRFIFSPKQSQKPFLKNFSGKNLKDETFNQLYIAKSSDICIKPDNKISCTRKACTKPKECGFIPNYPIIKFHTNSLRPINKWHPIEKVSEIFENFCFQNENET